MKKSKTYPARLILFGDEFSENLPDWIEGLVEEYDLTSRAPFKYCKEASILHDYVTHFDKDYKQARIVYHFNEKGLLLHRLYTLGPCFKIATSADSHKLERYSEQLHSYMDMDNLCYETRRLSSSFCKQIKLPRTNNLKKKLDLSFNEFEGSQLSFLHLAKKVITEFINSNFSI